MCQITRRQVILALLVLGVGVLGVYWIMSSYQAEAKTKRLLNRYLSENYPGRTFLITENGRDRNGYFVFEVTRISYVDATGKLHKEWKGCFLAVAAEGEKLRYRMPIRCDMIGMDLATSPEGEL